MLLVTGRIAVKADEIAVLLKAASEMVVATLAEEGCSRYHFSTTHFATFSDVLLSAADGSS
jgi:quinol monooxygenase YgiN